MTWNFDISAAPKSYTVTEKRLLKGELRDVTVERSVYLLAAYDGERVGKTRWLVSEGRWEGFKKGEQPEAWQPYPKHPSIEATS